MSFTVEDFHDLIELLAQHPEWRAELRRHVLSEDLIELPALVRQLIEAQAHTEARVTELIAAQAQTEARVAELTEAQARAETRLERVEGRLEGVEGRMDRVEAAIDRLTEAQARTEARVIELAEAQARAEARVIELAEAQARTEARVIELAEAQARSESRMDRVEAALGRLTDAQVRTEAILSRHTNQIGELQGDALELRYARRAPSYFSPIARRLHVIEHGALAELLDDAVDDDRLTIDERDEIMRADLVRTGRQRQNNQDVYLVAELSVGVGPHDAEQAASRALLLAKLGKQALPIVAGESITEQAVALAREHGVWYAEGGRVTPPRGA